jgi:DNA-binding GntR family transcriptional regulator
MTDVKGRPSFAGAAELVAQAQAATKHLKQVCAACAKGDKAAAKKALRQAIGELELARTMLQIGGE